MNGHFSKNDIQLANKCIQRHPPSQIISEMQLKITVKDGTESDVYYAVVNKIKVGGYNITKWEAGKHYVYTLNIKKTGISVTATITDWTTAEGSDDIWL